MTRSSFYGARSRRPVYLGSHRVAGLYERTNADGTTVYEVAQRLAGKVRRQTLTARTKTDAINEQRALQVDYYRGELQRSPAATPTVAELCHDWLTHLDTKIGHRDPRHRRSARTVVGYRQRAGAGSSPSWVIGPSPISPWPTCAGSSTGSALRKLRPQPRAAR